MTFGHCVVAFEQKHDEVEENNNQGDESLKRINACVKRDESY